MWVRRQAPRGWGQGCRGACLRTYIPADCVGGGCSSTNVLLDSFPLGCNLVGTRLHNSLEQLQRRSRNLMSGSAKRVISLVLLLAYLPQITGCHKTAPAAR
jgi:hypothetical protein